MTVIKYTEELYMINMKTRYVEDTAERIARHINDLRMDIHDEMSMLSIKNVDEAYQFSLKEKLKSMKN